MAAGSAFPTEFASPGESPGFLLWRVANRWQQLQRAALIDLGLTHAQFVLLAVAAWSTQEGAPLTQAELASRAGTDPMMTSQLLRTLEGRGNIERASDPRDARAKLVTVTAHGRELAERALVVIEEVDRGFFGVLGSPVGFADSLRALLRLE